MSKMSKLEYLNDKYYQLKKEMKENAEEALIEEFRKIFDKYPGLFSISWTQYTPYFYDGDVCEFRVHYIDINEHDEYLTPEEAENIPELKDDTYRKMVKEIEKIRDSIPEEILKDVFGDDSEVIVIKDKIIVNDYSGMHE